MSLPDEKLGLASFVQEEMVEGLSENLSRLLDQVHKSQEPQTHERRHEVEQPEAMKATLEVQPSGLLRLTLDTAVAPRRHHQH
jgi:hypothetical protein